MSDTSCLPRLLCLHGGGVNAAIFRRQCRALERALVPFYRLVYADGPYVCDAGPGVESVYADYGPFRRWLRWLPEHKPVDDKDAVRDIEACMRRAMLADDAAGGTGDWVGLIGFSQGAKVAASVLLEMQTRWNYTRQHFRDGEASDSTSQQMYTGFAGGSWRFGALFAGRGPLVALSGATFGTSSLDMPGEMGTLPCSRKTTYDTQKLVRPTCHVHGLKDPGLASHRAMFDEFSRKGSSEFVEWGGDHRMPIRSTDVNRVVTAILKAAKKADMQDFLGSEGNAMDVSSLIYHAGDE